MTQDEFNTVRDAIEEALNVIGEGCIDIASDELSMKELLMLQAMLQDVIRATEALERGNPEEAQMHLEWLEELGSDHDCPHCARERAEAMN